MTSTLSIPFSAIGGLLVGNGVQHQNTLQVIAGCLLLMIDGGIIGANAVVLYQKIQRQEQAK